MCSKVKKDSDPPIVAMGLLQILFTGLLWQLTAIAAVVALMALVASKSHAEVIDAFGFLLAIEGLLFSMIAKQFGCKRGVYEVSILVGILCLALPVAGPALALLRP